MDSIDSKCYHVSGANAIQTASVGTQCMDGGAIGTTINATNNSNTNDELTLTKSKAQLNSGNSYINIVPMQMGVQYHQRRKYPQQIQSDYQPSKIYFGATGRDDYYTLASTPIPLSSTMSDSVVNAGMMASHNNSGISTPLSIAVQQQTQMLQSNQQTSPMPPPPQQSNVPSVLYTVQRVITTSQIQSTEMLECTSSTATYQSHSHQMMSQMTETQQNSNYYAGTSNAPQNNTVSLNRPLQNVIPTCVYLMSRVAVHMEIEGTAQCPAQVYLAAALGCEELGISNKLLAQNIFSLWMNSTLLEIQLKPQHRPFGVRVAWPKLLNKFSNANALQKRYDEPMIQLRRNVFVSKREEEKIKDPRIIELLYEEARHNVLSGRYVLEAAHSIMLGGIQARIELGPYNMHTHTIGYFRENQFRFLPSHIAKNTSWSWMPISRKTSAEVKLLEQYKRVPTTATTRKLMRKYLEFCWALPFYGSAFFNAQIEQPVRGLMSLFNQQDEPVLVGINERGVFIIDNINGNLLLGLKYDELSWDLAKPSATDDPDCLPCIFIQFDAVENGMHTSKMMQVFSKQAPMMDALISHFAEMRRRKLGENGTENVAEEPNPIQNNGCGVLSNKLSKLTLATFDEEGRCIGQMGSMAISY
ncbi:FERM domain-containing protein 8 [Contarinia nasturtii]|uniref:FERM domain-containing protein 8 n=1 Tax=Contarinia nasturtii TaxID=265458 RepID=UPI0012D477C1|nr:FERM domain-containing protein 8 [Contarinia nasturtii]